MTIPIGTLCIIVGKLDYPPASRICTITHVPGDPYKGEPTSCNIVLSTGKQYCVGEWKWLRPITPPSPDSQVQRDRELETQ